MFEQKRNGVEEFVLSDTYRLLIGGLLVLLAAAMLYAFFNTTWYVLNLGAFNSDNTRVTENVGLVMPLFQGEIPDDGVVRMTALDLASGDHEVVPTLNLDRATAGEDGARVVDKVLYGYPVLAVILLGVGGLFFLRRFNIQTLLFSSFVAGLFIYLFPHFWETLSLIDFQGYEALPGRGPQVLIKNDLLDILNSFHNDSEAKSLGILILLVTFLAWAAHVIVSRGMFRRRYFTELGESVTEYVRSRSIREYIVAVTMLGVMVVILDWFYPLARNNPQTFYQFTYDGIREGMVLALIALGLVLIYKATDVINFAHGQMMMLGAFVFADLMLDDRLPLGWGIFFAALALVLVGAVIERFILRPLIGEPVISVIMVTIGLSNVIDAIVGLRWKNQPQNWLAREDLNAGFLPLIKDFLPSDSGLYKELESGNYQAFKEGTFQIAMSLKYQNIYLIIIGAILIVALMLLFRYSKQGIAMRATADDQQAALSMGISVKRIFAIAWGIAALLAGIAGILIGDIGTGASIDIPGKGLRAFPVIILGGLDSIAGAIIGGLMIGLLEQYAVGYIDGWIKGFDFVIPAASTKEVVPYIVLIVILMVRPYGLFGQEIIERV
ncbi:MAG: branched-chain amino acid ABC transporter permease [Chloroflexi bacterium]|nr:branched-chain amino acid ABC transporter permease [Chloroflexota bacterium]